jgi:hypothetical protein
MSSWSILLKIASTGSGVQGVLTTMHHAVCTGVVIWLVEVRLGSDDCTTLTTGGLEYDRLLLGLRLRWCE